MSSLLRSTKFVRFFTGAARTLILNTAKTTEVNTLINPKALCSFNNIGVRDYATTKKPESLEPLLQKLDLEVRRYGRITKRDIDEVFDEIRASHDITSSQSLLIIRCCGELVPEEPPEQRTLLVQKIWSVLTERGVPMDISHYNALLRVYLENEHPFSPAKFLEELEKKGLQPNRVTYQRLMWRYCQEGDVDGATKVLEKMRELNMPVSEPVLNALVMGHAFHGDTEGAKAVLETMAGAGLEPSNHTYALLACGYAKQGDIEGIEDVIKAANDKDVIMSDKDTLDIIEHLALGGHGDKIEKLFHHLKKGVGYNQDVCNLILKLLNKGQEDAAKKIMKTMPKSANVEDTIFKGAFFIKQLLRLNKPPESTIKTCLELKDEGLVPNAVYIATEAALQQGQVELAQELFKELKKEGVEIRMHYYWPLLVQKGKEGDEEGLLHIVRNMVGEGLMPSGETLRDYVIPYLIGKDTIENIILKLQIANVPIVHSARNLMIELLDSGKIRQAADIAVQYRPRGQYSMLTRPLLNALAITKDIESFATILQVISFNPQPLQNVEDNLNDDMINDDVQEVGRLIKLAVKNLSNPQLAEKLLKACLSRGIRISTDSAESIEQYLGEHMTTDLSNLLSQLTSADLEIIPIESPKRQAVAQNAAQLEQIYARLKTKDNTNLNRIQKQLLTAYIRENNPEKVDSFLKELKESNFDLNISTLAQLFEFYCQNDKIDKAMEVKARIAEKDPEFVLSKLKVIQMAYALIRSERYDEAIQYLKEYRPRDQDDSESFLYNAKCWQMLNTLAEKKESIKVKEMTKVLIDNEFIAPSNVILGPLIKVLLLKDDLEGALKEFEECCKTYRATPWKGELMKALIMKEDAAKLQWLADISTQIHGEVNILHDLVLAFVECGRLRQARRILETPGMLTRHRRLDDACQRYVEEGKSEYLEGLLEATKELSHIDRSNIFFHLLVTYCKADETDKALGLWTILQEEGEIPSDEFLTYLGNHLKTKNRPVPFRVPSEKPKRKPESAMKESPISTAQQKTEKSIKPALTRKSVTDTINTTIDKGNLEEAMNIAINSIKEGIMPNFPALKYLLKKLAETGNVETIQQLEKYLNDEQKRLVTYDDKVTNALFVRGEAVSHIDKLLEEVTAAKNEADLNPILKSFPRSYALSLIMDNEEIVKKCQKIAEIAASKGHVMPANILWMEYIIAGKDSEADSLWKLWLNNADRLLFRRLLQEAYVKKQPQLIEKLINSLKSNQKITQGTLAAAYSRLINLYLMENKTNEAVSTFENAIKMGIASSNFNKSTIARLKPVVEAQGKQFNY